MPRTYIANEPFVRPLDTAWEADRTSLGALLIPREVKTAMFGRDGDIACFDATLRVLYPYTDLKGDLGSSSKRWNDLWLGGRLRGPIGSVAGGYWHGGGIIVSDTTAVQNTGSSETTLFTSTFPPNTFLNDNDCALFETFGTFAANANAKQLRVKLDGTTFADFGSVAANSGSWFIRGTIRRSSSTAAKCAAYLLTDNATLTDQAKYASVTVADWTSGFRNLSLTGQATSTGDITKESNATWFWRAP